MASGIAINALVETTFKQLSNREHTVMVLKISEDMSEVRVEKTLKSSDDDLETEWKDFIKTLPENDSRYVVTDFRWKETPTVTKSKIILILWSPENGPIKSKMIYASSQEAVIAKVPVARSLQATETDDLGYSTIKSTIAT